MCPEDFCYEDLRPEDLYGQSIAEYQSNVLLGSNASLG